MDGRKFQVNVDQIFRYEIFRKVAFGAINRFLPAVKQAEWEDFMAKQIQEKMEIEEAAADTQTNSRVVSIFHRFCQHPVTETMKLAEERKLPYFDGKDIWFRPDDLMTLIDRQLKIPRVTAFGIMRDYGCVLLKQDGNEWMRWIADDRELWFTPFTGEQA